MTKITALHPLGQLYQQWALDYIIEAVRAIAQDEGNNPDKYRHVPDDVTALLAEFRNKVGTDPQWPSFAERNATYDAQLGEWFADAAAAFRLAAVTYVEKSTEAMRDISTAAATGAIDAFRVHLKAKGESTTQRRAAVATAMFHAAALVLRSPQLAQVFHEREASDSWPLDGGCDAAGANLVGAIAKELFPPVVGRMTAYKFLLLQRVADHGAHTLTYVLDNAPVEKVMAPAYAWYQAARELIPTSTIINAWRSESMRQEMSSIERSLMPPHPAGDVTMGGTELRSAMARIGRTGGFGGFGGFELGLSTHTVGEEVCCSTGDLSCISDASCVSVVEHCPTEGFCPTSPGSGLSCNGPCGSGRHHC